MSNREKLLDGEQFFYQDVFYDGDLAAAGKDNKSEPFAWGGTFGQLRFIAQLIGNGGSTATSTDACTVSIAGSNTKEGKFHVCMSATLETATSTASDGLYHVASGTFIDYIEPHPAYKYGQITVSGDKTMQGLTLKVGLAHR